MLCYLVLVCLFRYVNEFVGEATARFTSTGRSSALQTSQTKHFIVLGQIKYTPNSPELEPVCESFSS